MGILNYLKRHKISFNTCQTYRHLLYRNYTTLNLHMSNKDKTMQDLEIRSYLEETVMPILLEAMGEMAKTKPRNQIEFVAQYLLKHNPEKLHAMEKVAVKK